MKDYYRKNDDLHTLVNEFEACRFHPSESSTISIWQWRSGTLLTCRTTMRANR